MRNTFFYLIIFQISHGLIPVDTDNFEIVFSITSDNFCQSEEDRFKMMQATSIAHCVKECGARPHCEALNYRGKVNVCELFSTSKEDQLSVGDCLHVERKDIDIKQSPCLHNCKYGEVCESNGHGAGTCHIKGSDITAFQECVNITIPTHGKILGNRREVGKKVRYKCDKNYVAMDSTKEYVGECLDTGYWSAIVKCVLQNPMIGQDCTSNGDCLETEGTCIEGKCFCNPLYRYNSTMKDCVKVCNSISTDFEGFQNFGISGYNFKVGIAVDSADDCKAACINYSGETCLSVEVSNGETKCNIGSVTREMMLDAQPEKFSPLDGYHFFTRKCVE